MLLLSAGKVFILEMYYTYVLICELGPEKEFYIGSTENLQERMLSHKARSVTTTKKFDNIELVYYEACRSKTDARKRELQLKTGLGRGYLKKRLASDLRD